MATSRSSRPPFRADHVGSLLRPKALREAFRQWGGEADQHPLLQAAQDAAIRAAVELQESTGLEVVTDGEFRRSSYWGRFVARCQGFSIKPAIFAFRDDAGHATQFTATYASGKLARTQVLATDEFQFLRQTTKVTAKITMPAPSTMHFYRCTDFADPAIYPDHEAFFADLAAIYRAEIEDLARAGCRYLQLDEVAVAMLCDPAIRAQVTAAGLDPDALIDTYVAAINAAVAEAPADMWIGVHMCRGNFRGRYLSAGGYDSVAERFFGSANVSHFLLEYDTARAGDFRPLRFVPANKGVVLGLISTKQPHLQAIEDLKRRSDEAARFIDLNRAGISPQCGFASTAAGNPLTEADQRAKLRLVVAAARAIWG
jgi:5-methyltetrahydropteroyltriglutamate--homocysteine methyltransferase